MYELRYNNRENLLSAVYLPIIIKFLNNFFFINADLCNIMLFLLNYVKGYSISLPVMMAYFGLF